LVRLATEVITKKSSYLYASALALAGLVLVDPTVAQTGPFKPGCKLPFDSIKQKQSIDGKCGILGTGGAGGKLQNHQKNNFCVKGAAVTVTLDIFRQLQKLAEDQNLPFGDPFHLPTDRSVFKNVLGMPDGANIGEGSLVRLSVFVIEGHLTGKENVNCNLSGKVNYDAHITVGNAGDDDPCDGVVVETSPHYRPDAWDSDNLNHILRPIRFTGQLFFDASHKPCPDNPPRFSLWEIHPIYAIDVCKNGTLEECLADQDSIWTPLDEWLGAEGGAPK